MDQVAMPAIGRQIRRTPMIAAATPAMMVTTHCTWSVRKTIVRTTLISAAASQSTPAHFERLIMPPCALSRPLLPEPYQPLAGPPRPIIECSRQKSPSMNCERVTSVKESHYLVGKAVARMWLRVSTSSELRSRNWVTNSLIDRSPANRTPRYDREARSDHSASTKQRTG